MFSLGTHFIVNNLSQKNFLNNLSQWAIYFNRDVVYIE